MWKFLRKKKARENNFTKKKNFLFQLTFKLFYCNFSFPNIVKFLLEIVSTLNLLILAETMLSRKCYQNPWMRKSFQFQLRFIFCVQNSTRNLIILSLCFFSAKLSDYVLYIFQDRYTKPQEPCHEYQSLQTKNNFLLNISK